MTHNTVTIEGKQYAVIPVENVAAKTAPGDSVVTLTVNDQPYTVDLLADKTLGQMATLNEFIRTKTPWTGTKRNCGEGGCGACTVMLTDNSKSVAINSCLRPLASCNGMAVTTTEGIGSADKGYHPIQTKLAQMGGSQCGFCSPGFTMSMYSLLQQKKGSSLSETEIEEALHGNICRCTGFRPIIQADQTFATNKVSGGLTFDPLAPPRVTPVVASGDDVTWIDCTTETQLASLLDSYSKASPAPTDLMIANGRTSQGIWKTRKPDVVLNIWGVNELKYTRRTTAGFEIGAGTSISDVITFVETQKDATGGAHMGQFHEHLLKVAAKGIRNAASIGGNVMLTHLHQKEDDNFAYSDVTTSLYALGATLTIRDPAGSSSTISFEDFYPKTMTYSYLQAITIPFSTDGEIYRSYRIAARTALSHPFAVAGFRCTIKDGVVSADAPIAVVVGGCDLHPKQKTKTADLMKKIPVTDLAAFNSLAVVMKEECVPTPTAGRTGFRQDVLVNFMYKFFLNLQPTLPDHLKSAAQSWFVRAPLAGNQTFDTDPSLYPVTKAEPKINALKQVSGEAKYSGDVPDPANLVHLALVLSTEVGNFTVDTTKASKMEGWVAFFNAGHMSELCNHLVLQGPLLAEKETKYLGQAIGLVMANSPQHATVWFFIHFCDIFLGNEFRPKGEAFCTSNFSFLMRGALSNRKSTTSTNRLIFNIFFAQFSFVKSPNPPPPLQALARAVEVTYTNTKTPIVDIDEGISKRDFFTDLTFEEKAHLKKGDAKTGLANAQHADEVMFRLGEQYHFYMESQTAMAMPKGDGIGLKVYAATQAQGIVAAEVASAVGGLTAADIQIETTRCGGAYGGKIFNSAKPACWAAIVAHKTKRPAKIVMEIDDNFNNMGQRCPWRFDAKVGYNDDGKISAVEGTFYVKAGYADIDASASCPDVTTDCDNCYDIPNWKVDCKIVKTQTPPGTSCRGPGFVPAVFFAETLISHVAAKTNLSEEAVRAANYYKPNAVTPRGATLSHWANMTTILERLTASSKYTERMNEVGAFNAANTFVKRGISLTPVKYPFSYALYEFEVLVRCQKDGSCMVWSTGVELGQGLLTKVAETLCYNVGIPEELIRLQASDTSVVENLLSITGSSTSSELCCLAMENASATLNAILAPVRKSLPGTPTWQEIAAQADKMGVSMVAKGKSNENKPASHKPNQYQSYSAGIHEVEVDCLTGEVSLLRTDILFDAGRTVNPIIDVGQIEGGYLMGVGYALTEEMGRDAKTGHRTVENTWEYHVPSVADIPQTWNTGILKGIPNPDGIMKTKATAEPPVCIGVGIVKSVSNAVTAFNNAPHIQTELPFPVDQRQQACQDMAQAQFTFH